jgi:hypothetical protein
MQPSSRAHDALPLIARVEERSQLNVFGALGGDLRA